MQTSLASLTKRAIDLALKSQWKEAILLNQEILDKDPNNIDAKIRLGRAYLQTKDFYRAKKIFKEVLELDPINQIALKNYKMAFEKKIEKTHTEATNPKSLIIEPGTTTEAELIITAKRIMASDFAHGEELNVKVDKKVVNIFKNNKNEETLIGIIENDYVSKLNSAKAQGANIKANFVNGNEKKIKIIIKSSVPVFRSEKQEVKPYIKKGSIEEPELEIPELEDVQLE